MWGVVALSILLSGCDQLLGLPDIHVGSAARHCDHGGTFAAGMPLAIDGMYSVEAARFNPAQTVAYLSLCERQLRDAHDLAAGSRARRAG